jgi:ABC-type Na+ efflux pump permease subunit
MSFSVIFKKELKDSVTKGTLLFLFATVGGIIAFSFFMSDLPGSSDEKINIGVLNLDKGNISGNLHQILAGEANIVYPAFWDYVPISNDSEDNEIVQVVEPNATIEEAIEGTRNNGGDVLIVIEQGFDNSILNNKSGNITVYWIVDTYGAVDTMRTIKIEDLLQDVIFNLTKSLIPVDSKINSSIIMNPIDVKETTILKGETYEDTTYEQATAGIAMLQFVLPFMIIYLVMFLGTNIITAFTKERSYDTLETLLSFPIKRRDIILSKIIACIASIFIILGILNIGITILTNTLLESSATSENISLGLSSIDYFLIGVIVIASTICAMSLYVCSALFSSTGTKVFLLSLPTLCIFLIPFGLLVAFDFSSLSSMSKFVMCTIPGAQPGIAINSIVNGNYLMVMFNITYLFLFSMLMFYVAIRLFKSDRMVE